jgi:hypothetical protein
MTATIPRQVSTTWAVRTFSLRCAIHTSRLIASERANFSLLTALLCERTAPELRFMEAKWTSPVSYGMTVKVLKDFLPADECLNVLSVRNHMLEVAERCEAELGAEQVFFSDGCRRDWEALSLPEEPITVGIDGSYLRQWENKYTTLKIGALAGSAGFGGRLWSHPPPRFPQAFLSWPVQGRQWPVHHPVWKRSGCSSRTTN